MGGVIKLYQLLNYHSQNKFEDSLDNSFGDSYLMKHNRIYCQIRKKTLKYGYHYSDKYSSDYVALPLSQLEVMLQQKIIYYTDNVSVLKKIEERIPQTTLWDEVYDNLKRNFLFHESCHAVAKSVSEAYFQDGRNLLLLALLEESFANTCELLAVMDVNDRAHKDFYEFNSYAFVYEARSLMLELEKKFSMTTLFQFMHLCYLHANFLETDLQDKNFQRVLRYVSIDVKMHAHAEIKKLKNLSRIAFELNPRFIHVTTRFYLRYAGLLGTHQNDRKIDFMSLLESEPRFKTYLLALSEEICSIQTERLS